MLCQLPDPAKPGVPITKLAEIQNHVFTEAGFGDYTSLKWTRSRGHGQGLHLDEPPLIAPGNEMILQEGMVIAQDMSRVFRQSKFTFQSPCFCALRGAWRRHPSCHEPLDGESHDRRKENSILF